MARDPETEAEWQEAADAAEFQMMLDSAVRYGLILVNGQPESGANLERCEWILAEAKKRGLTPRKIWAR